MTENLRLQLTVDRVREELSKWFATCPYDGLEDFFEDEQFEDFVSSIAEGIRDDHGDQRMEEHRDELLDV